MTRLMERETGFEPATACLEGSASISTAGAGLLATNYRRGQSRLYAMQGVGLQPPLKLTCPNVPGCLTDIKAFVQVTVLFRSSSLPALQATSFPASPRFGAPFYVSYENLQSGSSSPLWPTKLDKIKNLRTAVQARVLGITTLKLALTLETASVVSQGILTYSETALARQANILD